MRNQRIAWAIALVALTSIVAQAQNAYELPFGSSGNTIELSVANTGVVDLSGVSVTLTASPSWLKFDQPEQHIQAVKTGEDAVALFSFSVEKSAPVKQNATVTFTVKGATGESWEKQISVTVAPPEKFTVHQNFPNPFNPTTCIAYELPLKSIVTMSIYDVLGREVATLVNGEKEAGYHEERWNATAFASGMYIYRITAVDERGQRQVAVKEMMLIR